MPSPSDPDQPEFRNPSLSDALQTRDLAAVAFALRHGPTVVPLRAEDDEALTTTDPATGQGVLLLFSDIAFARAALPGPVALRTPGWLRAFLDLYEGEVTTVILDVAGPHPMRAAAPDLLAALDA